MYSIYSHTISGGIFILAIWFTRLILKNHLPRWTFKILELIAIFYLLIPNRISSPLSVYNFTESKAVNTNAIHNSLPNWILILWILGEVICFIFLAINFIKVHEIVDRAIPLKNLDHKITDKNNIYYSDEITSPISSGIFHKKIIFPKEMVSLSFEQLNFIIRHETYHNLFQDNLIKVVGMLTLCLFWFHPCVWLLIHILYTDIEIVVDEAVVRHLDNEQKCEYSKAIVKFVDHGSVKMNLWYAGFSKNKFEERIVKIMTKRKNPYITGILSICLICGLFCMFATSSASLVNEDNTIINFDKYNSEGNGENIIKDFFVKLPERVE